MAGLVRTLDRHKPEWIAFNGKKAGKAGLGRPVDYGDQSERLGPSRAFVLPSTSGAARGFWDVSHWNALADAIASDQPNDGHA